MSEHGELFAALGFTPPLQLQLEVAQADLVHIIQLVDDDKAEEGGGPGCAGLELNSQSMGTIEVSDGDMVAILEGMEASKQNGDDIGVSILVIIIIIRSIFRGHSGVVANRDGD